MPCVKIHVTEKKYLVASSYIRLVHTKFRFFEV